MRQQSFPPLASRDSAAHRLGPERLRPSTPRSFSQTWNRCFQNGVGADKARPNGMLVDGAVQREPVLVGGERLGCRVGPDQGRIVQCEGSASSTLAGRNAVADRGGVQLVERVGGFQIEPGLFEVFDEEPSRVSLRTIRWTRRMSRRSRVGASGAPTRWNRGPFCSSVYTADCEAIS